MHAVITRSKNCINFSIYIFFSLYLDALGYGKLMIGVLWGVSVVVEILAFYTQSRWLHHFSLTGWLLVCSAVMVVRMLMTAWGAESLLLMLVARLTLTFTLPRPQLQLPNIAPAASLRRPDEAALFTGTRSVIRFSSKVTMITFSDMPATGKRIGHAAIDHMARVNERGSVVPRLAAKLLVNNSDLKSGETITDSCSRAHHLRGVKKSDIEIS